MKCKYCKKELPDGASFCCWCGKSLQVQEIKIPAARQLPSGKWNIQLKAEGVSITEDTRAKAEAKARAIRAGFVEEKARSRGTLRGAIDRYIESKSNVLSPSTIAGYRSMQRNRFPEYMDKQMRSVNWKQAVNNEIPRCSPKTMKNAWGFVKTVLNENGIETDGIDIPIAPKTERPWLTPEQIPVFLAAIRGEPCELPALLALHSLRRSEIAALLPQDVTPGGIRVNGAVVAGEHHRLVRRAQNKTAKSQRVVPVLIDRVLDILPDSGGIITGHINIPARQIDRICRKNGLPEVGMHGLRHTFASLAWSLGIDELTTMRYGGWSDFKTVHDIYTHLSDTDAQKGAAKIREFYSTF